MVYSVKCSECNQEYIGETARMLAPGSKNTQIENTPTPPLQNTPHPMVIVTHWMTPRSFLVRISGFLERSEKPSTFTRDPLPSTYTETMISTTPSPNPVPNPVT